MFRRWCTENKFNNAHNLSHVMMDGGVLSVPFDKLQDFNEKYVAAIASGEELFIVEQKSETYNFFVDIDYKDTTALTLEEIEEVCKVICDKVKRHGGRDCLVCVAPPKPVGDKVKTGVHLNWHRFCVDQASAIALREHILVALYTAKPGIDWNEVIDAAVYGDLARGSRGSGFRMPWSNKKAKCEGCQGRGCDACRGTGKITQVAYLPVFVYRHGPLSMLQRVPQEPTVEFLEMATVRSNSPTHATVEPPGRAIKEGCFTKAQMKDEMTDDVAKVTLEAFIKKHMRGQQNACVTKMFKSKNHFLVSTNSKYCENLRREHGSNHVWFLVSPDGTVAQKCFCKCDTLRERVDGFCKDFTGERYKLTVELHKMLYPTPVTSTGKPKRVTKCDSVKPELESFIQKQFPGHGETKLIKVTKARGSSYVLTTNTQYCDIIKGDHKECVSFTVKKDIIEQTCGCKGGRRLKLYPDTYKKLL
jgi:hypothetical protein